jgi:prepilin-type N-terminal cleavage/methylation domain-containing protein
MRNRGFTLIELLVVLLILAILTTVAVRSVDVVQDQTHYEVTQRSIQNVKEAIVGREGTVGDDASFSFVSDTGRLPILSGSGATRLQELWIAPDAGVMAPFALRSAPVPDADIVIGCGWRGPYMQLPIGQTGLTDGWGEPFVMLPAANGPLASIQSYGSDKAVGGNVADLYSGDIPISALTFSAADYSSTVAGKVFLNDDSTLPAPAATITLKLFMPDPDSGLVKVLLPTTAPNSGNNFTFQFSGVPIGRRVIRATDGSATCTQYFTMPRAGLAGVKLIMK